MELKLSIKEESLSSLFAFLKQTNLLITLTFLIFIQTGFAQGVTISPWKMNRGGGVISYNLTSGIHGDPVAYSQMNIPGASDPNWIAAPVNANGEINFVETSVLSSNGCFRELDFTYFETDLNIPVNFVISSLNVSFAAADDGARAYIFNSAHPNGAYIGEIKLGQTPVTADYASLAVVGENNRLVIVQYDDCPVGNNLTGAKVNVNGQVVVVNVDILPVVNCVQDLGNGLYQASFGYNNPNNREVTIDQAGSILKYNNGQLSANALNTFLQGSNDKVFTKEFGANDSVEWTITSFGNTHTVTANVNATKCSASPSPVPNRLIVPVIGNGKTVDIIGQELSALCQDVAGTNPSKIIFQLNGNKVLVEIVPDSGQMQSVINLLQGAPFNISSADFLLNLAEYANLSSVDVYMSKTSLCLLNNYANIINFARPVYPAINNSGGVTTQGDAGQTSNFVRDSYRTVNSAGAIVPVDGKNITIGVLSDSYDMALPGAQLAAIDVANGELPSDVVVIKDNAFKSSDEGRAMLQIIHDVAPGASLQFHTATSSPRQFEVGFNALALNSDIIVDDITFITEPFFGNGRISKAIQSFVSKPGKFHFTSAGNLANKAYQNTFSSSLNTPVTNFIPSGSATRAHVFGTNTDGSEDYLQKISVVPGTYLIALQWKEDAASQINSTGSLDDLDIYIVDDSGRLLVGSNRVNVNGDPTEIIVFRAIGTGNANILITSANGATNVPFRYIAFHTRADDGTPDGLKFDEYFGNGAPTISGHAMTPESITVGAVDYRNAANPIAESFSSKGGLLSDNTNLSVDLYAPDGGNTTLTTIGQLATCATCDGDQFLNFYGTSASAPHVAGAVALLMSAAPSWFPDGSGSTSFTANQALQAFKTSATSFTTPDGSNGGFVNTLATFKSLASPIAKVTELRVQDGKTPSLEPFIVTIIGEFFPETPVVLFDGQPLANVNRISDTEMTATIGTFTGNPELKIVTTGKTPGGTDGGTSDPSFFFDQGKIALNIIANNVQFEYGQDISLTYTVEGLPANTDLTKPFSEILTDLGLPPVSLNNAVIDQNIAAGDYPIVSDYAITPSFGGQDYDHNLFQINFISGYNDPVVGKKGYLTITKKDLTITPAPVTYTYGDAINIPLLYSYDASGITDNSQTSGFYGALSASHQSDFKDGLSNKFQALVNKFQALVNDYDLSFLNGGSWSASERTIQNKFQAMVNGMNVINLDNKNITNYIDARTNYDDGTTSKFQALVNKFQALVNAEDLFSGNIDLGDVNKFQALVSKFQALVNTEDTTRPYINYAKVFAIVDAEDAPPIDGSDDLRAISNMYSLNMITGLDVTIGTDVHNIYPGAFLNSMAANFNITYAKGNLTVLPKALKVGTNNVTIPYGKTLTNADLITNFDGWAFEGVYQESVATVFPDGIPYYFVKVGGNGTELGINDLKELGDYTIKIRDPKNYTLNYDDASLNTLTISAANLTFNPIALEVSYGQTPVIEPQFSGFSYAENVSIVFPDGVPYYFMKDGETPDCTTCVQYPIGQNMDIGIYNIFVKDVVTDNYKIVEGANKGKLTVTPRSVTVKTENLSTSYGYMLSQADFTTDFNTLAPNENASTVFPDGIPYYFINSSDIEFEMDAIKEIGHYIIRIRNTNNNYIFNFDDSASNSFDVTKKDLNVAIDNVYIYEDDTPQFTSTLVGFVNNENVETVFPSGIPYYFVDQNGIEQTETEEGAYTIKIRDPKNYTLVYDNDANLFVNPSRHEGKKVKVYTECVTYDSNAANGLMYTVTYRYKNKNHETIYVAKGENNYLSGTGSATSIGDLPTVFLPGSHTFTIQFNGQKMVWNLTTYGSKHKSSKSSYATSSSKKCKQSGDDDEHEDHGDNHDDNHSGNDDNHSDSQKIKVIIYPNPMHNEANVALDIKKKGKGEVKVFDYKGRKVFSKKAKNLKKGVKVNLRGKKTGNYFVRIKYKGKTYTATLLKNK